MKKLIPLVTALTAAAMAAPATADIPDESGIAELVRRTGRAEPIVRFINVNSGRCLDVISASPHAGADVQQYSCVDEPQQWFKVVSASKSYAVLQAQHNPRMCLDMRDGGLSNGTRVQIWDCQADNSAQQFSFVPQSDNSFAIVPRKTIEANPLRPKCLEVRNRSTQNSARIQQWTCDAANDDNPDVNTGQRFFAPTV